MKILQSLTGTMIYESYFDINKMKFVPHLIANDIRCM